MYIVSKAILTKFFENVVHAGLLVCRFIDHRLGRQCFWIDQEISRLMS